MVELAIIVPTLNEGGNVESLYHEIVDTLGDGSWELLFVDDDSVDDTRDRVYALGDVDSRVRLIHRIGRRGLSSACLEGMAASRSTYILVMDADLQHDTRQIPQLLAAVKEQDADLAVGSRFLETDPVQGLSAIRERGSRWVNRAIKRMTRMEMTDPLSGFFLMPRTTYSKIQYRVSGLGFKLLLDILLSAPRPLHVVEVPFQFRNRQEGESKLDISIVGEFLGLMLEKMTGGRIPVRFLSFVTVGCVGAVVHLSIMYVLYLVLGFSFLIAQVAATYAAIVFNFLLNNIFTYRDQRIWRVGPLIKGGVLFTLVCSVGAFNNILVAEALYRWGRPWFVASLTGSIYGSVWNYFVTSFLVWFKKS